MVKLRARDERVSKVENILSRWKEVVVVVVVECVRVRR